MASAAFRKRAAAASAAVKSSDMEDFLCLAVSRYEVISLP